MSSFYLIITKNIILAMVTLIAVFCIYSQTSDSQDNVRPIIWTASAMDAIELQQRSPRLTSNNSEEIRSIQLMAAKGEYEAFQIVIQAPPGNFSHSDSSPLSPAGSKDS